MELDLTDLQRELSLSLPSVPDTREVVDLAPLRNATGLRTEPRGLRRLLKRILLRR